MLKRRSADRADRRAGAIVLVLDAAGRVVSASKSFEELLGYAPHGELSLSIADIVHPEDIGTARELLRGAVADGVEAGGAVRVRDVAGAWRLFAGRVEPERGPGGTSFGRATLR